MAVLKSSAEKTNPMDTKTNIHSIDDILRNTPKLIAKTVANRCIKALCSSFSKSLTPANAYVNDFALFFNENFFLIIFAHFYIKTKIHQRHITLVYLLFHLFSIYKQKVLISNYPFKRLIANHAIKPDDVSSERSFKLNCGV